MLSAAFVHNIFFLPLPFAIRCLSLSIFFPPSSSLLHILRSLPFTATITAQHNGKTPDRISYGRSGTLDLSLVLPKLMGKRRKTSCPWAGRRWTTLSTASSTSSKCLIPSDKGAVGGSFKNSGSYSASLLF